MGGRVFYLRVAHPPAQWGAAGDDDVAKHLEELAANRAAWSLYAGDAAPPSTAPTFAGLVLAGFWGWREGKVPLSATGYLAFDEQELSLTGGTLRATPSGCTFPWPYELVDVHWDLEGHTEAGVRALAAAVPFRDRLQRVERPLLYMEQARLLQRDDCHDDYRKLVVERMIKLARNEKPIFDRVRVACAEAGVRFPFAG